MRISENNLISCINLTNVPMLNRTVPRAAILNKFQKI